MEEPSQTKLRDATSLGRLKQGQEVNVMAPVFLFWNMGSNDEKMELVNRIVKSLKSLKPVKLIGAAHSITHPADGTLQGMTPCSHRSSKGFFSFLGQSQLLGQVASKTIP